MSVSKHSGVLRLRFFMGGDLLLCADSKSALLAFGLQTPYENHSQMKNCGLRRENLITFAQILNQLNPIIYIIIDNTKYILFVVCVQKRFHDFIVTQF